MITGRENGKESGNTNLFVLILLFATLFPPLLYAQDNSVIISPPTSAGITDTFKVRDIHPVTGAPGRPHRGIDYGLGCGTALQARDGGALSCRSQGSVGYGNYGDVTHECGVFERYGHLQSCNSSTGSMVSGNTGGSTGCHLHYEIRINGVAVDPQEAFGKELCDPAVQQALIEDAQNKLNGLAGGGGTGGAGGGTSVSTNPVVGPIPPTTDILVPTVENTENPPTGCDTEVWRAMVNLSVLQTRREMVMNETFVAKPDSVLPYACFISMFQNAGENLGVFSESQRWRNRQINVNGRTTTINVELGQSSLDGAISNAALSAYESYMDEYFEHAFLGGTVPDNTALAGPQAYAECGIMARVWQAAKCRNVDDGTFPSFADLVENDPRVFPEGLECDDAGITENMITTARHLDVETSPITMHREMLDVAANGGECFPVIRTGVTVIRRQGEEQITEEISYEDGLCITAGCSYQRAEDGEGEGSCEVKEP